MDGRAYVFLFPGQGSQSSRMGRDFYRSYPLAREVFGCADELLGRDLSGLMFSGSGREIERTENLQPAIATVNAVILALLRDHGIQPIAAAGHSLGEYNALQAAGVLPFDELMLLVAVRGRLMGQAATEHPGGMVSVIGIGEEELASVVEEASGSGVVCIANLNSPEQVVLSGDHGALDEASRLALAAGAKRVVPLPVSGAWHSPLMEQASVAFEEELAAACFKDGRIDIYSNVSATPARDAGRLRELLVRQMCSPVRWVTSMQAMIDDHPGATFVEVGPGRVLMGLALRIDRRCRVRNVDSVASFEKFLSKIA